MDHVSLLHLAWKGQYSSFQELLPWKDTFHCCCMRMKPSDSDVKGRGTSGKGHYPLFQLIWENSCVINLYWWFQNVQIRVLSCSQVFHQLNITFSPILAHLLFLPSCHTFCSLPTPRQIHALPCPPFLPLHLFFFLSFLFPLLIDYVQQSHLILSFNFVTIRKPSVSFLITNYMPFKNTAPRGKINFLSLSPLSSVSPKLGIET